MRMKVSWVREGIFVCIFSDPFPNICHPVIDDRSLIPLTTMCLYRRVCFHLHKLRDKFFRHQLAKGQRHRISALSRSTRYTENYLKHVSASKLPGLKNSLKLGKL